MDGAARASQLIMRERRPDDPLTIKLLDTLPAREGLHQLVSASIAGKSRLLCMNGYPRLFTLVKPYMSETDTEAGELWDYVLSTELEASDFGIACVSLATWTRVG